MKKALILLMFLPLLLSCTSGEGTEGKSIPETPMRVLFIGNSFLVDASEFLPQMLKVAGIGTVEMDRMYHGSYALSGYNANYDNPAIGGWMSYRPGYASWKGDNSYAHSVREIVESGIWDCVVFNDESLSEKVSVADMCADINSLISKIDAHQNGHPVKYYYVLTQPNGHGNPTLTERYAGDQEAQFRYEVSRTRALIENTALDDVISTGAMVQNLRSSVLNIDPKGQDISRDGHHMDYGIGRYGAACVVFGKIFTPVYGVDIADIRIRTEWSCSHPNLFATPVTYANAPIVVQAAACALEEPYMVTSLSSLPAGSVPDTADEVLDEPRTVTFPVEFPVGYRNGKPLIGSDAQSRLRSEGVWECADQRQAYVRWHWGPRELTEASYPYMTFLSSQDKISSPEPLGLWDGDFWEFMIPVENFPAGTVLHFYAPFYGRQHPVFWDLEYFDGGEWKVLHKKSRTVSGHTCESSLEMGLGTTYIDEDIVFSSAIEKGWIRLRLKVVKGAWQMDTSTGRIIERTTPYVEDSGKYGAPVYFYTDDPARQNAVILSLK